MKTRTYCAFALVMVVAIFPLTTSLRASAEGDELRAADADLNKIYQTALATLPNEAAKRKLREAQRAWIAYRDAEVALYAEMGRGGGGLKIIQTELTDERAKRLKGIAEDARQGTTQ